MWKEPLRCDANIQIESAFFNRVPIPVANSLLLFCLGAVLFAYRRAMLTKTKTIKNSIRT